MPDVSMAGDAVSHLPSPVLFHTADNLPVAGPAVLHGYPFVEITDLNRFMKASCAKSKTVVPSINSFDRIFADDILGCMTGIAHSNGFMAGPVPSVKMFPHDVAVAAGPGIIVEIGKTLCVKNGEYG